MRFTLGRVVHFYYVITLCLILGVFAYGVNYYWDIGLLNIEYVSNLYDGTSKVRAVKERNDIDEIKKYADGDRIKDAERVFLRLEQDIQNLKSIKPTDSNATFEENTKKIKVGLINFQTSLELSAILNNISSKVGFFESFVTEKKWPSLMKMAINLRVKTSPSRLMQGGLFNFEKTQTLSLSISNDIEAMTNFTESSGLPADIKIAIVNRIQVIKNEALSLINYVDEHKKFNRIYKEFTADYNTWFKFVEPEIALKKIQFEKSSQTIIYSLIAVFSSLLAFLVFGVIIYNYSCKRGSQKSEKIILDTIKENIISEDVKKSITFSPEFISEIEKYRDYIHKRMSFGTIFQDAMPFASILLDSNLNLVWGNSHFYEQWQLQNFNIDGDDSLTWDFLQRFTNLEDNSSILNALRMSTSGKYKIQVKNASMAKSLPYEMHVSPVEYSSQKRIMVIFYPMAETEMRLDAQKEEIVSPLLKVVDAYLNETMTIELKNKLRIESENAGAKNIFTMISQYVEKSESYRDELSGEIERLESKVVTKKKIIEDVKKSLITSFETQRVSIDKYSQFKVSVTAVLESRDLLEEQFKYTLNTSRDFHKDQSKIFNTALKSEKMVDDYAKSLKLITDLKSQIKDQKHSVDEFKSRIIQTLDQLLIFQNHDDGTLRVDQFLGKIKLEMKGFEKVLNGFNQIVTQLDVTVTKLDMMLESREKIDLSEIQSRLDSLKNNLDNSHFSAAKISQNSHAKDDEMISSLKLVILNLKSEMKRVDDLCRLTGVQLSQSESPSANC